jgi:hypothetical protein
MMLTFMSERRKDSKMGDCDGNDWVCEDTGSYTKIDEEDEQISGQTDTVTAYFFLFFIL